MVDYSILVSQVPLGGRAVANINTTDSGIASDIDSITTVWRDQSGTILKSLTRTTVDLTSTDIYGNAVTLTDPSGVGNYQATLVIDNSHYTPGSGGFQWSLQVTIVKGAASTVQTFYFTIVQSTLSIALDATNVAAAAMRQVGWTEDVIWSCKDTNSRIPLQSSGPIYALTAVYRDATLLSRPTDYTWSLYQSNITLVVPPSVNTHIVATIQKRSDAFVADVVNRTIEEVRSALQMHYDSTAVLNSPTSLEIAKAIVIGQFKQDMAMGGPAMDSATYRSGVDLQKFGREWLAKIKRGEQTIYDTTGAAYTRRTGSLVGYYKSPLGDYTNRLGIQDRAQRHTGMFIYLTPSPILSPPQRTLSSSV